jgi:hypothetical protein
LRLLSIAWVSQHDKRKEDDYKIIFNCRIIDRKKEAGKGRKRPKKTEKDRKRPKRMKKAEKAEKAEKVEKAGKDQKRPKKTGKGWKRLEKAGKGPNFKQSHKFVCTEFN